MHGLNFSGNPKPLTRKRPMTLTTTKDINYISKVYIRPSKPNCDVVQFMTAYFASVSRAGMQYPGDDPCRLHNVGISKPERNDSLSLCQKTWICISLSLDKSTTVLYTLTLPKNVSMV